MRFTHYTALVVLILDQISKFWVVHLLELDRKRVIEVLPPWLDFRIAWNRGVNFGLFSNSAEFGRWILIALALGISTWVWLWVRRAAHRPIVHVSAGLLIGGALGNVVDRLIYGAVADFLNVGFPGFDNPYSFNVADIAIFVGAAGLVLFTGREKTP
ncbi:signal peptidase II [Ostreiculturibacter nitratireducens]|uniref:signal peptidase II n=1 Tax=Ostreiculturibacter nitratireducens TaxID=3075226 RepID=UPI0031B60876